MLKTTRFLPIIIFLLLGLFFWPGSASAQTEPVVRVDPVFMKVDPNDSFSVNIIVENVQDLFAFDIILSFDPNFLTVDHVEWGEFLTPGLLIPGIIVDPTGSVRCGTSQVSPPSFPVSGDGVLFTIYFSATEREGETLLQFEQADLVDGIDFTMITNQTQTGTIQIGEEKTDYFTYLPLIVLSGEY